MRRSSSPTNLIAAKNEELLLRSAVADLDFALTQLQLAAKATDKRLREKYLVSAKHCYDCARGAVEQLVLHPHWRIDIRFKLERIGQALTRFVTASNGGSVSAM